MSQKVCYCCGSNQHHLAICPNTEKKDELMNSFSHMEDTMRKCFTEDDKAIIRRDVESRKRKAKSSKDVEDEDYMDVDDEDIELPEEEPELGGKVPPHSPRAKVDHTRQTLQKRNTRKRSRQPRRPLGTPVSSPDSKSPSTSLALPMTKKEESTGSQITGLIDQVLMESGNLMHLFRRLQHSE